MLARSNPERARYLVALAQADVVKRWQYYQQLAGEMRSLPSDGGGPALTGLALDPSEDLP